ncbi:MAG: formate dehydrogenase accessory sulfurtransferase FdhD [Nitriliruptorales bacterium]
MRRPGTRTRVRLSAYRDGEAKDRVDTLATEEPLEIRVLSDGTVSTAAVTMRTPGADFELAAGFLHGEGIVGGPGDLQAISYCVDPDVDEEQRYNIVNVALAGSHADVGRLERHFTMTSACGVCGKASLDALELRGIPPVVSDVTVDTATLSALPERLSAAQTIFERTGGLHAAGLFTPDGELVAVREDVGRHNALDKLIGWALLDARLPLSDAVVLVSGRASFELLQKSVAAGVPVVCAVSAPSSLAVDVAERFGATLVGFLRGRRFNVYTNADRVRL